MIPSQREILRGFLRGGGFRLFANFPGLYWAIEILRPSWPMAIFWGGLCTDVGPPCARAGLFAPWEAACGAVSPGAWGGHSCRGGYLSRGAFWASVEAPRCGFIFWGAMGAAGCSGGHFFAIMPLRSAGSSQGLEEANQSIEPLIHS